MSAIDRITRLALQTLDAIDSSGNASRWLLARSKKGRPVKTASSYDVERLRQRIDPPFQTSQAFSYSLPDIMSVRDLQMAGLFAQPVEMSAAMNADDAIFVARQARLAPIEAMAVALEAANDKGKATRVAAQSEPCFGEGGTALSKADEKAINRDLADHGVAIGCNEWCPRPDGSGIDVVHRHWPLRDVEWDPGTERLVALVRVDGDPPPTTAPAHQMRTGRYISRVPIVHGDGRWAIYQNQAHHSWQHDAAILPGCLVWARHAFGAGDWAAVSRSHGSPKWVGTLGDSDGPLQVPVLDSEGKPTDQVQLSEQGKALLDLVADMAGLPMPYGVKPHGSEVELIVNSSTAWQVFSELMLNAEKAAARIWTGTDALLGAQGGAPGIDISALFGVASTIIQGDLGTISRGFDGGVIVPHTALNHGTSALAPKRVYQIPDPDLQKAREQTIANEQAYVAMVNARHEATFRHPSDVTATNIVAFNRWATETARSLGVQPVLLSEPVAEEAPASGVRPAA